MKVTAEQFFATLHAEDGVTFRDLSPLVGFVAYDMHGNRIGTASYEQDAYAFYID